MYSRATIIVGAVLLLWAGSPAAYNLLDYPEEIMFDSLRNRYIVVNCNNGSLVEVDEDLDKHLLYTYQPSGYPICTTRGTIVGDTAYVSAESKQILVFDLSGDTLAYHINLPTSGVPLGMASDRTTYLYIEDSNGKIIRMRLDNKSWEVFADEGLGSSLIACVYDGAHNRLIVGQYEEGTNLKAVDLSDGAVSLLENTGEGWILGMGIDEDGYVFVSRGAWGGNEFFIQRYEPTFTSPPEIFVEGLGLAGSLEYNRRDSVLAVPLVNLDSVVFIQDIFKYDSDDDGYVDAYDNCPFVPDGTQADDDDDGVGNVCDNCPAIYNPAQEDLDGDGIGDSCEINHTWWVFAEGGGATPTIQTAIDSSYHGDTIRLADGLYTGDGNRDLDFHGCRIVLMSEHGSGQTIIDCQGSPDTPRRAFLFEHARDSESVVEGLTIMNGYGPLYSGTSTGGAVVCAGGSPIFRQCVFFSNASILGGAIYCTQAHPEFINCTFAANSGNYGSVAMAFNNGVPRFEDCILAFNTNSEPAYCLEAGSFVMSCCNVWGNPSGDYTGCLGGLQGIDGNFSADPLFCNLNIGDVGLSDDTSPCLAANNSCGKLIGALGLACMYPCDCGVWGDIDGSGTTNPVDVVFMVNFVYKNQDARVQPFNCPYESGDANCDNTINPVDVVYFVNFVYKNQNALCEPCGD